MLDLLLSRPQSVPCERQSMVCVSVGRDNPRATCTMISSVDLTHYGVSRAKDSVIVDCGTSRLCKTATLTSHFIFQYILHGL